MKTPATPVVSILALLFASGCFLLKTKPDKISEKRDAQGRLISKAVKGYDYEIGFFDHTFQYDTLGRLLREYGFTDHTKFSRYYAYDSLGRITKEEWYDGDIDDTLHVFDRTDCRLRQITEHRYHPNGESAYLFDVEFSYTSGDTFNYLHEEFDSLGKKVKSLYRYPDCKSLSNFANDSVIVYIMLKDEIAQTIDTILVKKGLSEQCGECETR